MNPGLGLGFGATTCLLRRGEIGHQRCVSLERAIDLTLALGGKIGHYARGAGHFVSPVTMESTVTADPEVDQSTPEFAAEMTPARRGRASRVGDIVTSTSC